MSNDSYDIFISYRRENGASTAKHLRDILTSKGYRVFFDTDSLRSGDFNRELLDVIKGCTDFIIILSPNALDRCVNEQDWVRQELACALDHGKNIVPVMSDKFVFPETLPKDVDAIRWKNGIAVNIEYFDAMVEKLLSFLKSKPHKNKTLLWVVAGIVAVAAVAVILVFFIKPGSEDEGGPAEDTAVEAGEKAGGIAPEVKTDIASAGDTQTSQPGSDVQVSTSQPEADAEVAGGTSTQGAATAGDTSTQETASAGDTSTQEMASAGDTSTQETASAGNISIEGKIFEYLPLSDFKGSEYYGDYVPRGTAVIKDKGGNTYTAVANSLSMGPRNYMYQGFYSGVHNTAEMFSEPEYVFDDGVSFHEMISIKASGEQFEIATVYGGSVNVTLPDIDEEYYLYFIEKDAEDEATRLETTEIDTVEFDWSRTPETNLKYCRITTDDGYTFRVPVAQFWFAVNRGSKYPLVYLQNNLQPLIDNTASLSGMKSITSELREEEDGKTPYLTVTLGSGQKREAKCDRYFAFYLMGMDGAMIRMHAGEIPELIVE
ncbi:MAG: toll/interleukin-1 receptor domain-containing protein [Lachnospiraceae bacterium]|nr:toll/interleukin-1 receptor domain-containing protein [Lachnospiraceae bacterium]